MTLSIECQTKHLQVLKESGYENQQVNSTESGGYEG